MVDVSAQRSERVAAFLKQMPAEASFKFAEAAGVFAPIALLVVDTPMDRERVPGRIAKSSLPGIWRWLSRDAVPHAASLALEAFTESALGLSSDLARVRDTVRALHQEIAAASDRLAAEIDLPSENVSADARLFLGAVIVRDDLRALTPELSWDRRVGAAKDINDRAPGGLLAYVSAVVTAAPKPSDAVALLLTLTRRRDEHRLDQAALSQALDAAAYAWRTYGEDVLGAADLNAADALSVANARFLCITDARAALRGHVTPAWVTSFAHRVAQSGATAQATCGRCASRIADVLDDPRAGVRRYSVADVVDCAKFLVGAQAVAAELGFEAARRAAWSDVVRRLSGAASARLLQSLCKLNKTSTSRADHFSDIVVGVIRVIDDERTAAAWGRRGRAAMERPWFQERVLRAVEPLIVDIPGAVVRAGQAARSTTDALWEWTRGLALSPTLDEFEREYDATCQTDQAAATVVARRARICFAAALADRLKGAASDVGDGFPTGEACDQARAVSAALDADAKIFRLVSGWPSPVKHVNAEHVSAVYSAHLELGAANPDIEPALLHIVMDRLQRPWQVLRVLERIAKTTNDTLIEATEFVALGDVLIDRAARDAENFTLLPGEPLLADRVLLALESFSGITSGMTEEFNIRHDGRWGKRLYPLKASAARRLEELCVLAKAAIDRVTPRRGGSSGGPDVSETLDETTIADAVEFARFLAKTQVLDQRVAFTGARSRAMAHVDMRLEQQIDALLSMAHDGQGDDREGALAQLAMLAKVVTQFHGGEAATIVRRRAAAA